MTVRFVPALVAIVVTLGGTSILPAQPKASTRASDVFALLDAGDDAALLRESPETLLAAIRRGRDPSAASLRPGERLVEIEDGYGRTTQLALVVPPDIQGLLIVLHGYGASYRHLKDGHFNRFARQEGLVIAAPTAQQEPPSAPNEDFVPVGPYRKHWWSYRAESFVLRTLQRAKRELGIDEDRVLVAGYSMGGFATWNVGLRYADRFAAIMPICGGLSRRDYVMTEGDPVLHRLLENGFHVPAYFIHGTADTVVPVRFARTIRDRLVELESVHRYVEVPEGGHLLPVRESGALMQAAQDWLKTRRRDPHPKEVRLVTISPDDRQAFWVRVEAVKGRRPATVRAWVPARNRIEVETRRVKALTLFLDPELHDVTRPISVRVNGAPAFQGTPTYGSEVVIESWRAREDRQLLYPAKVRVEVPKVH